MPARILAAPFIIMVVSLLYITWEVDERYSVYMVPTVIVLAIIYTLSPQINWWWYKRRPPELDMPVRQLFNQRFHYYQELSPDEKKRFRERVALYILAKDFMPQVADSVPEDLKAMIAACAVQVTFGKEDYLMDKFERIIVYPKPFPSPQHPEKFHASEIFEEDGVLLFSAEQLAKGFLEPQQFYNVGLHEYAKVFRLNYPGYSWPKLPADIWEKLEQVSGMNRDFIVKWINLDDIEPFPVSIVHFFQHPRQFQLVLPELYESYRQILTQDPAALISL